MSRKAWRGCTHASEGDEAQCRCVEEAVFDLEPLYFRNARNDGQPWIDVDFNDLVDPQLFFDNGSSRFYDMDGLAVKTSKIEDSVHQIEMMELAGDCSVRVVGRFWGHQGLIDGLVMSREKDMELDLSEAEKWATVRELVDLLRGLHNKNIIHGDVKTGNILRCTDGKLRFIDFNPARVEGDDFRLAWCTPEYSSPRRVANFEEPVTKADDIFGLGATIWELFAGMIPYSYASEELGEFAALTMTEKGILLDLSYVESARAQAVIQSCFDGVPPSDAMMDHACSVL